MIEVGAGNADGVAKTLSSQKIFFRKIGSSNDSNRIVIRNNGQEIVHKDLQKLKASWQSALSEVWQ